MPKCRNDLTAAQLCELLSYDPETGIFRWRISTGTRAAGAQAGGPHVNGYVRIKTEKRFYLAHRLAWLYAHGRWPAEQIDHINGIRTDNRIANLREATGIENQQNRTLRKGNKSGHPGVCWNARDRKWQAQITAFGRRIYLGRFDLIEHAIAARVAAKARHHTFNPIDRTTDKREHA